MTSPLGSPGSLPAGYDFIRSLGFGASGWVALAEQTDLGRLVAIKTVLTGVHDTTGQERLEREGQAIVSLRHPHIVTAYTLIPSPGGAALVMEYLPGGDLRTAIASGGIHGGQAVQLLTQVAQGLSHAHSRGVVHRDIKPENILLGERPDLTGMSLQVKIADFGLARLPRAAGAFRTRSGGRSGTPDYMAPEQITEPDAEAPSMDTYAFCVLAYELLTGALPYPHRDPGAVLAAHLHDTPVPVWDVAPGFPFRAGGALLAGLAKNPADRPTLTELTRSLLDVPAEHWDAVSRTAAPPATIAPSLNRHPGTTDRATQRSWHESHSPATVYPTHASTEPASSTGPAREQSAAALPASPEQPVVVQPSGALAMAGQMPIDVPVYQPPKLPIIRRRAIYLSVAIGAGSALGVTLILLAGRR